jgi:hypothetical protein
MLVSGCARDGDSVAPPQVEPFEVIVEPGQLSLQAGGTAMLAGQVNDSKGFPIGGAPLQFAVAAGAPLRVNAQGIVESTGPAVDRTYIIISSGAREKRVPVQVTAAPLGRLEKISGDEQSVTAGAIPGPVIVRAVDSWGNPVPGTALVLETRWGGAPLPASSDAQGNATFELPLVKTAGAERLLVRPANGNAPTATFNAHVVPGAPAQLRAADEVLQSSGGVSCRLRVLDAYGNPVAGIAVQPSAPSIWAGMTPQSSDPGGWVTFNLDYAPRQRSRPREAVFRLVKEPSVTATVALDAPSPKG